ncbi:Ribbon-helix-helix protein, copG family [Sanguibacter keddieii DSM 10542]|uniref:Ribbon-helix-helix protein, copG family n=1 Tax=Sanguibacter keddieii (strain ATCC 51767 / DSM 10542 / NCFB 3025 / ST-74) TaxID=446469 RepID=D1BAE8_SANKS|nr:ribbon-helix-helix protein, CopG family [Sanguibacter keddieii]ACZ20499.1 Ribbon-helix-helix protein, copG family [Sanguibacter keddieii DSM 10542]
MSSETDRQLAQWAESGLTKPRRAVTGPQAGAEARAMLETAGVDVAAVERRVGRPRLDGSPPKPHGQRSPRVNVAVSDQTNQAIESARLKLGVSRSDFVRKALDSYIASAS